MGDLLDKKNDFLYFDEEANRVKITAAAMNLQEVQILYRRDKSVKKVYFNKCLVYCYYYNHKDSPIVHQPESIKRSNIKTLFDGMLSSFDYSNPFYRAFENAFIRNHHSRLEIRFLKLLKDIDDLIEKLSDIPLYKKIKVEVPVEVSECLDGEMKTVTKKIKVEHTIDNSTEKKNAIMNIKHLDELREMLEKKIRTEYSQKRKISRRLFDQ